MLPELFLERLKKIVGEDLYSDVLLTFHSERSKSLRINPLKNDHQDIAGFFRSQNIDAQKAVFGDHSWVILNRSVQELSRMEEVCNGKFYLQSLSSMLPVHVLDPQPGEVVLDLCAAPGSKTTQMAAHMGNKGRIVAVDSVRPRYYRLKSVLQLLGVEIAEAKCLDGKRFRSGEVLFDRILVDAPCSSESRFRSSDPKSVGYWSKKKIQEMVHKQKGLLLNACRLLKPGGVLVYSTCTFAPEENEGVLDWVLRKFPEGLKVVPFHIEGVDRYPAILQWDKHQYHESLRECFRVLPTDLMEGFFLAKLIRLN